MSQVFESIFSTGFFFSVIRVATPLILASMGAVITSNAGITNIGIEGVMLVSALTGVFASAYGFGPWFGLLISIITGVLCSLAIGYVSMSLKADSALTCIAFNTMAVGGTVYFMYAVVKDKGTTIALNSGKLPSLEIPLIKDIPVLGEILSNHNVVSYMALVMIFVVYVLLYKTPLGLRIRSAGKAPNALSSVGVSFLKTRYIALGISGVLGGMAGAFMSMGYVTWFSKNMTAGRGFIALAADAMGNSTPLGAALSAMLFAIAEALSYALQITTISPELVQMLPYAVTILGLIIYSVKKSSSDKKKREQLAKN
ncbi:simple sugar transport system permease protein [Herbinix hemicellulosilytica]|uniref:Putative membrane protein n=1 Tax=Herbinix hemicellulosilytica TaxID=1564487 RepID=A0A0H5SIS5_HERHM|nr:ABC transporter permease [Herbinix hemicellulosilytica]RBP59145.1 simple sugar transport system permease protein [Herbinix hemicellulosilytica]CRZ35412.1 putative membrane protein [Herbinix hemicellulosilytica]